MMTRKHFKAIAEILNKNNASSQIKTEFAMFCLGENERFDYARFLEACNQ